jgi:pyruvate/2-oxoglutarate dehydrogenase complex dihydrolipoamide acyltransferase (E2) component
MGETSLDVTLPQLGFSVAEAVLAEWFVQDGDYVELGQRLYSMESDKSMQEIEAPIAGVVKILCGAGHTYPVGRVLARITPRRGP